MDYVIDQYLIQYLPFEPSKTQNETIKYFAAEILHWADWTCSTADPGRLFDGHPQVVIADLTFMMLFAMLLLHALFRGGRTWFAWLGIGALGLSHELLRVTVPELDTRWYAQSVATWFGRRLPLWALVRHHITMYPAFIAIQHLHLPLWSSALGVGLLTALLSAPLEMVGVRTLLWTWHDTEPLLQARIQEVPWVQLHVTAATATSYVLVLTVFRYILRLNGPYDWKCFMREGFVCGVAGMCSTMIGLVTVLPVFELARKLQQPIGVLAAFLFLLYAFALWAHDRNPTRLARQPPVSLDYILLLVSIAFCFVMVAAARIVQIDSIHITGLFQPIGPCNVRQHSYNALGQIVERSPLLCVSSYKEPFDWHCTKERRPPQPMNEEPVEWYSLCGQSASSSTAGVGEGEWRTVAVGCALVAFCMLMAALTCSGPFPHQAVLPPKKVKRKKE